MPAAVGALSIDAFDSVEIIGSQERVLGVTLKVDSYPRTSAYSRPHSRDFMTIASIASNLPRDARSLVALPAGRTTRARARRAGL